MTPPAKRKRSKRSNRPDPNSAKARRAFWGEVEGVPEVEQSVRITNEPSAIIQSLGRPPLHGMETAAEHYLEAVYTHAVNLAGALAAAGELIEPEDLQAEDDV